MKIEIYCYHLIIFVCLDLGLEEPEDFNTNFSFRKLNTLPVKHIALLLTVSFRKALLISFLYKGEKNALIGIARFFSAINVGAQLQSWAKVHRPLNDSWRLI